MSSPSIHYNAAEHNSKPNLRYLIENISEPLVIKGALNWELLNWDIQKWHDVLGNEKLPFRCGKNTSTLKPQFENETEVIELTFKEFLDNSVKDSDRWYYFDYKYLNEWLRNIPELRKHVNWEPFGFPELKPEDGTIWIGSKGAHTPCHIDTYGCNIVVQIHGKKRWMLFPPDEDLHSTRIPYEESSIYSSLNLFSPRLNDFENIIHCRSIILNPGDALILPHRWWHYVENLELAISINTWIQLPIDHEERIKEAIVQMLVSEVVRPLDRRLQLQFMNPLSNSQSTVASEDPLDSFRTLLLCLECFKNHQELSTDKFNISELLKEFNNVQIVEEMPRLTFIELLEFQRARFPCLHETSDSLKERNESKQIGKVINAILHNDVIDLIKRKLLEQD